MKYFYSFRAIALLTALCAFPLVTYSQADKKNQGQQHQQAKPQAQPHQAAKPQGQQQAAKPVQQPPRVTPSNSPQRASQPSNIPTRSGQPANPPSRNANQGNPPIRPGQQVNQNPRNASQGNPPIRPGQQGNQSPRNAQGNPPIRPNQPSNAPFGGTQRAGQPAGVQGRGGINAAQGGRVYRGASGNEAQFRRDGSVAQVRSHGMEITHGPSGTRRIVAEGPGHRVIVTNAAGHGYVQRPYSFHGHDYVSRTFYSHGVPYNRVYRPFEYHGHFLNAYIPYRYYSPGFYLWTMGLWGPAISFRWGWYGDPWYGYYGWYFSPYTVYPGPAYWLTDFAMAGILQASYQERLDALAGAPPPPYPTGPTELTPEVKNAITQEIDRQLAEERAQAQAGSPDVVRSVVDEISDNRLHVFVVSSAEEVTTADGSGCPISVGDVHGFQGVVPPDAAAVNLQVVASKSGDCARGAWVSLPIEDLQEMQNRLRDFIDQGLEQLREHKGGLPPLPASAQGPVVENSTAAAAPPPDTDIVSELKQQAQAGTQAEQEVVAESGGLTEGAEISLNQTIDDVVAVLGKPNQIVKLGDKQIYVYKNLKITFINGRVADVQ